VLTVREGFYDEVLEADGTPRSHAQTIVHALEQLGPEALAQAGRRRDAIFMQQGITFDAAGPDADVKIGHGRNYADVPPIKGVFRGRAGAELSASVRMTRSDPSPARA
jgi:uncharacterized circularly permuted ATP-grasp superfamily protein